MIVNSVFIKKFRGFENVEFSLGKNLTVIAGQNGTQKTTLLGILSQPFTISDKDHPIYGEKPLCGGNYKSLFGEKFKLSENFDVPYSHEWTLRVNKDEYSEFTIQSIKRSGKRTPGSAGLRFWKKGDRSKGSGYIQLPVIYLSLSRLFPIGEDEELDSSDGILLSEEEFNFFRKWHNKILIIPDGDITAVDYLESRQKNTLGVSTSYYDWRMNSAGQDNIGKILLAVLSFKRLQGKYKNKYEGGILVIDELDATIYPGSQLKLIDALRTFSSQYNIQVVFTTHSLNILEKSCDWQFEPRLKGQVKVVFLEKQDREVIVHEGISYEFIKDKLNVAISSVEPTKKIPVFTEDLEAAIFLKAIIKRRSANLELLDCSLGCTELIELVRKRIPGFRSHQSMVVLDGDVNADTSILRRISGLKNIVVLPGTESPERLIAHFLFNLSDKSEIWASIHRGYSKQIAFRDIAYNEIKGTSTRGKAKEWFNSQKRYWGKGAARVINPWIDENQEDVNKFIVSFENLLKTYN